MTDIKDLGMIVKIDYNSPFLPTFLSKYKLDIPPKSIVPDVGYIAISSPTSRAFIPSTAVLDHISLEEWAGLNGVRL